jgi:hypothetical protein
VCVFCCSVVRPSGFEEVIAGWSYAALLKRSNRTADKVFVERAVVDRAEAETVANDRLACLFGVADDVRRVAQPDLVEPTDRASVSVCGEQQRRGL